MNGTLLQLPIFAFFICSCIFVSADDSTLDNELIKDDQAFIPMEKRLHSLSLLRMNKLANLRSDSDNPLPNYPNMEKRLHSLSLLRTNKFGPNNKPESDFSSGIQKRLHSLSLLRMNKFAPKQQESDNFSGYGIQKRLHNLSLLRMNKFARPNIPEAKRRFFEDFSYASK